MMMEEPSILDRMRQTISTRLVPWCKAGAMQVVLARFPLRLPENMRATSRPESLLAKPKYHAYAINPMRWPALSLHAARYPCIGYVMEGEMDVLVGEIAPAAVASRAPRRRSAVHTLPVVPGNALLLPSGVPYSDATDSLWHRASPGPPDGHILWMHMHPTGCLLQLSYLKGGRHVQAQKIYVNDTRLLPQVNILISCAANHRSGAAETTGAGLLTLMLILQKDLLEGTGPTAAFSLDKDRYDIDHETGRTTGSGNAAVLERACAYIRSESAMRISLEDVAGCAFVSVRQLTRIFRAELGMSVADFIAQQRVNEMKALLTETNVCMEDIAVITGCRHRSNFSRFFIREVGISPSEFRRRVRTT